MYPKNRDTIGEKDVVGRSGRLGGAVGGCAGPLLGGAYGRSELEVDERLDGAAFNLDDNIDYGYYQQSIYHYIAAFECTDNIFLPSIGQVMTYISEEHKSKYIFISRQYLYEEFGMESRKHPTEHTPSNSKRRASEKYPRKTYEMESKHDSHKTPPSMAPIMPISVQHICSEKFMRHQCKAVHAAPSHEVETRTMPKSAKKHGYKQIEILAYLSPTVAAQRYIDIIAYPCRQRNVPTSPKVGNARTVVGRIEVQREVETQQQGYADSHIAIAAEIAINLQSVAIDAQQIFYTAIKCGIIKYAIHEVQTDIIADNRLLEQSYHNEIHPAREHVVRDNNGLSYLWSEVCRPYNRPCNQLGEERNIESIVEYRWQRFQRTAVHIDSIAETLKGKETYTYR